MARLPYGRLFYSSPRLLHGLRPADHSRRRGLYSHAAHRTIPGPRASAGRCRRRLYRGQRSDCRIRRYYASRAADQRRRRHEVHHLLQRQQRHQPDHRYLRSQPRSRPRRRRHREPRQHCFRTSPHCGQASRSHRRQDLAELRLRRRRLLARRPLLHALHEQLS